MAKKKEVKKSRIDSLRDLIKTVDESKLMLLEPSLEILADLENRLKDLRTKDFIIFNPKNPAQSKQTAAGKQYKEFLQAYNNTLKIVMNAIRTNDAPIDDGLDDFIKQFNAGL